MWEIIGKSFEMMFKRPIFFVPALLPAVISLVLALLGIGFMYNQTDTSMAIGFVIVFIGIALSFTAMLIANSVIIHMAYEYEAYNRLNLSESFNIVMNKLGIIFLVSTIIGIASAIGIVLFVLPGIVVILFTLFSMQEVVLLNKDVKEAIMGSYELVKQKFGSVIVFLLIMFIISLPISIILKFIPIIGPAAASLIIGTLSPIATTLFYMQLREDQL
ncbi:hypothetical protein [Hippea sp. KM1]|uniref:hypothetical protein n=1 Tax=Hippea sp. KM1 TaxID=944481 RepID=UPI00046D8022|nr:hypothetical protein [Hippea sp. KM1]